MVVHACPTCDRQFGRKQHLDKHLKKKSKCSAQDMLCRPHECPSCEKSFKHQCNLSRHKSVCKGVVSDVQALQAEVAQLRQQVQQLTVGSLAGPSVIDNSINDNRTQVLNVTINNYGSEKQDYLETMTYPQLKKILKLSPDNESLLNMIKFIHNNKDHPENINIRLESKDSDVINVFKNSVWREEKTDPTIYDIICRNSVRFVDVQQQLTSGMAKRKFEALTNYLEKAEDMANSEDASLYSTEFAFTDLIGKVKDILV